MPRPTTTVIYYKRAFDNMRRCLVEASSQNHAYAAKKMTLKNPYDGQPCTVMQIDHAIRWCVEYHANTWASSTWRMTRLGYELLLNQLLSQQKIAKPTADGLFELMKEVRPLKKNERDKKTSARRKKNMTEEQFQQIRNYLTKKRNKWGKALLVWLLAGVATGLRPNEWQTATLKEDGGRLLLTSENFKANEVRSYAKERVIDITDLPERFILAVKEHLDVVSHMTQQNLYDKYAKGCADLLRLCNKTLWPKRKANITLYTGRHQFSANAKAEGDCDEKERAAMMGHKTVMTSRERYGRRRTGSKGLTPHIGDPSVLALIQAPDKGSISFTPEKNKKKSL